MEVFEVPQNIKHVSNVPRLFGRNNVIKFRKLLYHNRGIKIIILNILKS